MDYFFLAMSLSRRVKKARVSARALRTLAEYELIEGAELAGVYVLPSDDANVWKGTIFVHQGMTSLLISSLLFSLTLALSVSLSLLISATMYKVCGRAGYSHLQ